MKKVQESQTQAFHLIKAANDIATTLSSSCSYMQAIHVTTHIVLPHLNHLINGKRNTTTILPNEIRDIHRLRSYHQHCFQGKQRLRLRYMVLYIQHFIESITDTP